MMISLCWSLAWIHFLQTWNSKIHRVCIDSEYHNMTAWRNIYYKFQALTKYEIKKNTNVKKHQINKLNERKMIVSSRELPNQQAEWKANKALTRSFLGSLSTKWNFYPEPTTFEFGTVWFSRHCLIQYYPVWQYVVHRPWVFFCL